MFKITKFVIAAALTAIIAAPIMAQVPVCPCWALENLATEEFAGEDLGCIFGSTEHYVLLLGEDVTTNRLEQAQVSINLRDEKKCLYQQSQGNSYKLHDLNEGEYAACGSTLKEACEARDLE